MVIGEAPGATEDLLGMPFVGRSGKVLDSLLEAAGFDLKNEVYICNAVKCRPPNNRRPNKFEILEAAPWLDKQIELVDPWVILLAGSTAVEATMSVKKPISEIRGSWLEWKERLVMPIFHPSYLLRKPSKVQGQPLALTRKDFYEVSNRINLIKESIGMKLTTSKGWFLK